MKIPGSITPIQPQLPVSRSSDRSGAPAESSVHFGAPSCLHPRDSAIAAPHGFAASFRDPSRLAARSEGRAAGLDTLKQQLGKQFGADLAAKLFPSKAGEPPPELGTDGGGNLRFKP